MRIGRVVVGVVVVLTTVAVAFFVHTMRDKDPDDSTGTSPDYPCPSGVPPRDLSVWGIEVDKNQHPNSRGGDWTAVAETAHPPAFAYLKTSEGERDPIEVNSFVQRDTEAARELGITVGFVHWAVPGEPRGLSVEEDAVAEARAAVRAMGGSLRGTLPPALALGINRRNLPPEEIAAWTLAWLGEVERLVERPPVLVAGTRFLTKSVSPDPELATYPLWLHGPGCVPAPWTDWTFRDAGESDLGTPYFDIAPPAVVYAGSAKDLRKLAATGTGIGPGPPHAHAHRWR